MGWSICTEEDEVVSSADTEEGRLTKRCIAPMISNFVRERWSGDDETMLTNSTLQQAWLLEQEWGEVLEGVEMLAKEANGIKQIAGRAEVCQCRND